MEKQRVLVTSALPYANGPIHLGHLAGAYLPADIFVRFCRLLGREVIYICGTDEHGVPITITADQKKVSPQEIVDFYYEKILDSFTRAGISFTHFSRTSRKIHHDTSQDFFLRLLEKGYLEKKLEQQLYCASCGRFLPDRYVEGTCHYCGAEGAKGDQCETCGKPIDPTLLLNPVCKLCGAVPEVRGTEHWYMQLGRFQEQLENWLASKTYWKENVLGFCRGTLAEGLKERAVTRDLNWGVPVPLENTEGKVLYVWFDAPIGYVSSTKEWAIQTGEPERWKDYWWNAQTRLVHFIGKDNIFFHALMFPAMMMAYGHYVLPDNVPANEYLNLEGLKFSTSRNQAVWLADYLDSFEPDPLRYYLCSNMPETRDMDFSLKQVQAHNNNELADTVGNFINRTLTFIGRYFDGRIPPRGELDELDRQMLAAINDIGPRMGRNLDSFRFRAAIEDFGEFTRFGNKYFNDKSPWQTRKSDPEDCATTLNLCAQAIYAVSVVMWPVMPFSAEKLWAQLNLPTDWQSHSWAAGFADYLPEGHPLGKVEVLFPKIEDSQVEKQPGRAGKAEGEKKEVKPEDQEQTIEFDEFSRLVIRVAVVKSAEPVQGSDKLLKLTVDLGTEQRTLVAGIAEHYKAETLPGRRVLVAVNLKPRKVMGIVSQGMILAAEDGGRLGLATLDSESDIPPGARIC